MAAGGQNGNRGAVRLPGLAGNGCQGGGFEGSQALARPAAEQRRIWGVMSRLLQMLEKMRRLEKEVEELPGRPGAGV